MRLFFGFLGLWLGIYSVGARAEGTAPAQFQLPNDIWHQVTAKSPFYAPQTAMLRMAAVIQSDGRFARIVFVDGVEGAYVTVNLPGTVPAKSIRSDLIYSGGGIMTRVVADTALETQVMTTSESVTYSFPVVADDIRAFRGATKWTLTPEGGPATEITLKGSAKAIRAALADPRPIPLPVPEEPAMPSPLQVQYGNLPLGLTATQ